MMNTVYPLERFWLKKNRTSGGESNGKEEEEKEKELMRRESCLVEWENRVKEKEEAMIQVPIYLNETRSQLLYVVDLKHVNTIPTEMWRERAVSIICWRQS